MNLWNFLKQLFGGTVKKLLKLFKQFINDAFTVSNKIIIAEYKDFAISVVEELSLSNLTNAQKRKEAFKRIKTKAKKEGKELKESLINTLIELAVQYNKKVEEESE